MSHWSKKIPLIFELCTHFEVARGQMWNLKTFHGREKLWVDVTTAQHKFYVCNFISFSLPQFTSVWASNVVTVRTTEWSEAVAFRSTCRLHSSSSFDVLDEAFHLLQEITSEYLLRFYYWIFSSFLFHSTSTFFSSFSQPSFTQFSFLWIPYPVKIPKSNMKCGKQIKFLIQLPPHRNLRH